MNYQYICHRLLFLLVVSICLPTYGQDRIFRSEDGGRSWEVSAAGFPQRTMVVDFIDEGTSILAATNGDGLFASRDNGQSWSPIGSGLPTNISALTKHNDLLFASPWRAGVFVSRDHGNTWQACNFGLTDLEVNTFLSIDQGLFIGTSTGIFYSWNSGKTWIKILAAAQINDLLVQGTTIHAAGAKGIYRSLDRGKNWQQVVSNRGVSAIYHSDFGLFATSYRDGLLRSVDEGAHWELAENGLPELRQKTFTFCQLADRLYIGHMDGVYYSDTHGIHWIKQEGDFNREKALTKLYVLPDGTILAGVVYPGGDGC